MSLLGHDPVIMLEAPIPATQAALKKAGMRISDIDLYEVNEAFAPCPWPGCRPRAPIRRGSTSTAAPLRWAIRWAPRAPSSWPR